MTIEPVWKLRRNEPMKRFPVAAQKVANMKAFLDNVENSHLSHDRSKGNATQQPAAGAFKVGDKRTIGGVDYTRDAKGNWSPK